MPSKVLEKKTVFASANGANGVSDSAAGSGASENSEIFEIIEEKADHLGELKKILVEPNAVSAVLPEALKISAEKDSRLSKVTLPLVEMNIRESIQRNPQILAEAIFPILLPAIRKAILEALSQMVQSFNQTLEQSVSVRGLRWRVESWKTGKNFGEVVMLNTLLYRVEQVFLIHKNTGILLNHVAAQKNEQNTDADMVSAMLTAIQDFVQDSFQNSEGATLDSLKVRELSVWIEHSPSAILAVVIRGNAPLNLREILTETIERVQLQYERQLVEFEGETAHFETSRPLLEDCLRMQTSEQTGNKRSVFTPFNFLAAAGLLLILTAGFFFVRDYLRWSNYLARLKAEDGIAVTEAERGFFKHEISGLRSRDALDPESILPEFGYSRNDVESHWKIYRDLNPKYILERANKILKPPATAQLSLDDGILTVRGTAPYEWLLEARETSKSISGVDGFKVKR